MWRSRRMSRLCGALMALWALSVSGCASLQMPKIDPTGEHLFESGPIQPRANTPYQDQPGGPLPWDDVAVRLVPQQQVAPVGTEVVLLAGVIGPDNFYRTNRRLEWAISDGSVGNFVDVGRGGLCDLMVGDFNQPRKVSPTYAIGSTSRSNLRLNRGTGNPCDDNFVLAGQGWISVTSPVEGTTNVNVYAPEVYPWDKRTQSAVIHWVDVQWAFPPPVNVPVGSRQALTTSVIRHTDRNPCAGWRVRYDVLDSQVAGFGPDGAPSMEVVTNEAGQATVEIFQKQPLAGTNRIGIQLFRPATATGSGGVAIPIANGSTMVTWTSAVVQVNKRGPATGTVGATLTYRTEVTNPGDRATQDLTLTEDLPEALTLLGTSPPATVFGRKLTWRLGILRPNEKRTIEVNCRAERPGTVNCCAQVSAFGGLQASDCAATTIVPVGAAPGETQAKVELKVTGPVKARVGDDVSFTATITSHLPRAEKFDIVDRFEPGLVHLETGKTKSIERSLGTLEPNKPFSVDINFKVVQPGNLSHTVEIYSGTELLASQSIFLKAEAAGSAAEAGPPAAAGGAAAGGSLADRFGRGTPRPAGALKVTKTGPETQIVGKPVTFTIAVTNTGGATVSDITITDTCDPAMEPARVSERADRPDPRTLVWKVPQLLAGQSKEIDVEYNCKTAAAKACARTRVTAATGETGGADGCLTITEAGGPAAGLGGAAAAGGLADRYGAPAPAASGESGGLTLSLTGTGNSIPSGRTETYTITVTNQGRSIDRLVRLTVQLPVGMTPSALGTTGPPFAKARIDRQTVSFDGVPELRSGDSLTYRVVAQTRQVGQMKVRAEVTSMNQPRPVSVEKVTEVTPRP